jgi:hypothetical protein
MALDASASNRASSETRCCGVPGVGGNAHPAASDDAPAAARCGDLSRACCRKRSGVGGNEDSGAGASERLAAPGCEHAGASGDSEGRCGERSGAGDCEQVGGNEHSGVCSGEPPVVIGNEESDVEGIKRPGPAAFPETLAPGDDKQARGWQSCSAGRAARRVGSFRIRVGPSGRGANAATNNSTSRFDLPDPAASST